MRQKVVKYTQYGINNEVRVVARETCTHKIKFKQEVMLERLKEYRMSH